MHARSRPIWVVGTGYKQVVDNCTECGIWFYCRVDLPPVLVRRRGGALRDVLGRLRRAAAGRPVGRQPGGGGGGGTPRRGSPVLLRQPVRRRHPLLGRLRLGQGDALVGSTLAGKCGKHFFFFCCSVATCHFSHVLVVGHFPTHPYLSTTHCHFPHIFLIKLLSTVQGIFFFVRLQVISCLPPTPSLVPDWKEEWSARLRAHSTIRFAKMWLEHQVKTESAAALYTGTTLPDQTCTLYLVGNISIVLYVKHTLYSTTCTVKFAYD